MKFIQETKAKIKANPISSLVGVVGAFYLAKKYLTPEGEKECYNFLRSQGIP